MTKAPGIYEVDVAAPSRKRTVPVGVPALREAVGSARIPVLALGGITPERIRSLRGSGVAGVAAISAILMAADPASVVRAMAEGLASDGEAGPAAGAR